MSFPEPNLINIAANGANFMFGRNGTPVRKITYHHVVGPASSAVAKFQQPIQVSAHFVVDTDKIYCMVNTDDTAYCNGNWASNLESVTIEHAGTWLNGFRDEGVIEQSAKLTAWLRSLYPNATPNRHRDVMATQCPGDLPVEEIWARASDLLDPPAPVPAPAPQPEWLVNRKTFTKTLYVQVAGARLWNLNDPSQPADTRQFPVNTQIDVGSKTTVGGKDYYITVYSTGKNLSVGYKAEELADKPYSAPVQPTPAPTPQPVPVPTPVDPEPKATKTNKALLAFFAALGAAVAAVIAALT